MLDASIDAYDKEKRCFRTSIDPELLGGIVTYFPNVVTGVTESRTLSFVVLSSQDRMVKIKGL